MSYQRDVAGADASSRVVLQVLLELLLDLLGVFDQRQQRRAGLRAADELVLSNSSAAFDAIHC